MDASDQPSVAARARRLTIIGWAGIGSMFGVWILLLIVAVILPGSLPAAAYWITGALSLMSLCVGYGALIYMNVKPELKAYVKERKQAGKDREREVQAQIRAGTYRPPRPMLYGFAMGFGVALLGYFVISFLIGFLGIAIAERPDLVHDPAASAARPGCVLPIYVPLTIALPFLVDTISKDRKAQIGYAIGVALVWIPLLFVIF